MIQIEVELDLLERRNMKEEVSVPIYHKLNLTIEEAAEYSNIGINRLRMLISEPDCPFALFVGNKKLIKRQKFEEYINSKDRKSVV